MEFRIDLVPAADTWELRRAVLRPHQRRDEMALPDDDQPLTASVAAINESGRTVGTGRVGLGPSPTSLATFVGGQLAGEPATWRLRGMATREDARQAGIGSAVLRRLIRHVEEHGVGCCGATPGYRRSISTGEPDSWSTARPGTTRSSAPTW